METNLNLILHNIISIISSLILLGTALFTFLNDKKKIINITISIATLAVTVFTISHLIGVNITDPDLSRFVLMFNLSMFFIGSFLVHSVLYIIGRERGNKWIIILFHSVAIFFIIFFIIFPDLFLLPSIPKMYFPNYYSPGILNWVRIAFLDGICAPYLIYLLISAYRKAESKLIKNQHLYLLIVMLVSLVPGFIPNFLVYNIKIDPIIGMLFPVFFIIPFLYGAVKYEMLNVKIIAKQAFFYAIGIIVIGGLIILLNYSNGIMKEFFPNYPTWITAIISAILVMTISTFVWKHLREGDLLKYEFITTVTHKFRTPLTGIKWATENLSNSKMSPEDAEQIKYIKNANEKLVELTDLLVTTSETEHNSYQYRFTKNNVSELVNEVGNSIFSQMQAKKLNINKDIVENLIIDCDTNKIKFVIQTLIENAIHYTKEGGGISIKLKNNQKEIVFSVTDTGMGISKEESALIFSKFYRTHEARNNDTEGMGIGLFIAKEIISRHNGKIWAESAGLDKGSVFSFSIPLTQ